jgi:hypothetical protein
LAAMVFCSMGGPLDAISTSIWNRVEAFLFVLQNQVDNALHNQVDNPDEANKKSTSFEVDSSIFVPILLLE